MTSKNLKIFFFGTPEIATTILNALINSEFKPSVAITRIDKPRGRSNVPEKSPVKVLAEKEGLKIFQPSTKVVLEEFVKKEKPDLIIVTAFGMILTKETLEAAKLGAINVHPSLLPLYRGPSPITAPILNGDKKTGTTIMMMSEGMDEGDILSQTEFPLSGTETTDTLTAKLAEISGDLLVSTLDKWIAGELKPVAQEDKNATYTMMVKKEDGKINWEEQTATEIEQMSRAYNPWPGVYTFWNGKKLDLFELKTENLPLTPGKVTTHGDTIIIGTKKGAIMPGFLKLEGKSKITSAEFLRGYQSFNNSNLI